MTANTETPTQVASDKENYLALGNAAMRAGDYKQAKELFESALRHFPELESFITFNLMLLKERTNEADYFCESSKNDSKRFEDNTFFENVSGNILIKTLSYEGKLEKNNSSGFRGWAVNINKPSEIFDLDVFLDDIFFCKINNSESRADLQKAGKSEGKGGFRFSIPEIMFDKEEHIIEIKFPDGSSLDRISLKGQQAKTIDDLILFPVEEHVSVIVPIYNAVDDVHVCIERLKSYTPKNIDIILINDASTDPRIKAVLDDAQCTPNFRIFNNDKNLGFTKTVNRGIELAGENDVILLNSDARVTPRWIQGFQRALATDYKIATVTAMSDRAGAFSAPNIGNDNELPSEVREEDYAIAFRRNSIGAYPTVPTGNGFCMYIRRSCIKQIGILDADAFPRGYGEENDFCMRARAAGWRNIIDDRTYIFHDRSKSFGGEKEELIKAGRAIIDLRYPDYKKATAIFKESPLLKVARFKAKHALKSCSSKILPRGLFVISTLTGGTPQTNRDLMLALSDRVEGWLLHCNSKIISLYRVYKDKEDELIRQHILKEQVEVLTHISSEYDRVITNWLYEYDFEFVHIRHLAWHSLSLPKLAKLTGAKVINSFHDFYALCPTVKLLDGDNKYCDGKCTRQSGNACKPDLWGENSLPTLKNAWVKSWRENFRQALSYCDVFITTHDSVRETILEHLAIPAEDFYVIPHGRDFDKFYQLAEPYKEGEVLKILVPGNVSIPKGSKVIEQLLELDTEESLHFHILGKSNIKFRHPRLTFHGEYERDDFADHVKKICPHIGAVLSIWNETWCHTLTELWSVGVPVISFNYKTISDRIVTNQAGWVLHGESAKEIFKELNEVRLELEKNKTKKKFETVFKNLKASNLKSMADKYYSFYLSEFG